LEENKLTWRTVSVVAQTSSVFSALEKRFVRAGESRLLASGSVFSLAEITGCACPPDRSAGIDMRGHPA
jgi:hypothetical protein